MAAKVIAAGALGANVSFGFTVTIFDSELSIGTPPVPTETAAYKIEILFIKLEETVGKVDLGDWCLVQYLSGFCFRLRAINVIAKKVCRY